MILLFDDRVYLQVEIPADPAWGLRGRTFLAPDAGMLFQSSGPMTMRETDLPLDIAFVRDGVVTSIRTFPAHYPNQIHGEGQYVVEANAGFFTDHDLRPGMPVVADTDFLDLFVQQRALFARWYPKAARTTVAFTKEACTKPELCSKRDLAYAELERNVIVFHPRILGLPVDNQTGLIRHELAHIVDSVPYVINTGGEQRADDIAERVTHQKIRYDRDLIQTVGAGTYPRPRGIHS